MSRFWLGLCMLLGMSTLAFTQDELKGSQKESYGAFEAEIRIISLGGEFDSETDWDDVWKTGGGISVAYAHYWRVNPSIETGLYAKLTLDFFSGDSQEGFDPDPGVQFFEFDIDTLAMERIIIGGVTRFNIEKFFIDVRGGIGVAFYSAVEVDYEDETSIVTGLELIDPSAAFSAEFGIKAGLHVSRRVDLSLGVMLETNGAPDIGVDFDGEDPETQVNFSTNIGIGINF